jgi:Photosynthesis system II assembly factor YCF48
MMAKIIIVSVLIIVSIFCKAQKIEVLTTGNKISIRGLSVVTDNVFWVSGSNGTVGNSFDGGKTINWMKVKGYDSTDFRDIEAFSSVEAIIMGIGEPAVILKTIDAGKTWKKVYENKTKGMFLDAMEFWNPQSGIAIGDPIDGKFFFTRTFDEGNTWMDVPNAKIPVAIEGEACFASSGTNFRTFGNAEGVFITGGKKSRFFIRGNPVELPIIQGTESTGANSIAINKKQKNIIIVGGDFTKKEDVTDNCVLSNNKGKTFTKPTTPPSGYRSCVEFYSKSDAITCGLNGVDISKDKGNNWMKISDESFHVCRKAKEGKTVYLAGGNGKIGKLSN